MYASLNKHILIRKLWNSALITKLTRSPTHWFPSQSCSWTGWSTFLDSISLKKRSDSKLWGHNHLFGGRRCFTSSERPFCYCGGLLFTSDPRLALQKNWQWQSTDSQLFRFSLTLSNWYLKTLGWMSPWSHGRTQ